MKKIVCGDIRTYNILDPKEYIIIEEDNQRISDKYVDYYGKKINEYKEFNVLEKGDVVIREFYRINFWGQGIFVHFKKFKYYNRYRNSYELTPKLKKGIRMKNSVFDFNYIKEEIVELFSKEILLS